MIGTRPVQYRQLTPDEVLAELKLFCRNWGVTDADLAKYLRPEALLLEMAEKVEPEADWGDLEHRFGSKLREEWWEAWTPNHTVGELCENLATGTRVPVLEPVTILGTRCETAGTFLTLRRMLADAGADVSELGPSSEVKPYLDAWPTVFQRFRLATGGRLPVFGAVAPWSCLLGGLLVIAGVVLLCSAPWLLAVGGVVTTFGLSRPTRYRLDGMTTFRDLIHAALGRTPRARTA